MAACLGSLAVKRVLGKDETPGSNPGLGFLWVRRFRVFCTVVECCVPFPRYGLFSDATTVLVSVPIPS